MGPGRLRELGAGTEPERHERRGPQHVVETVELAEPGLGRRQALRGAVRPGEGLCPHGGDVPGNVRVQPLEVDGAEPPLEFRIVAAETRDPGADRGQVDGPDAPRRQRQALRQDVEGGVHAPEPEQDVAGQGGEVLPEPPLEARRGRRLAAG